MSSAAFKLFLWGRSGVGKTSLVSFLGGVGLSSSSSSLCETPGLRVTDVYWPVKLVVDSRIVLLKLSLWDFGEAAGRKYAHINPVRERERTLDADLSPPPPPGGKMVTDKLNVFSHIFKKNVFFPYCYNIWKILDLLPNQNGYH